MKPVAARGDEGAHGEVDEVSGLDLLRLVMAHVQKDSGGGPGTTGSGFNHTQVRYEITRTE